ncbi:Concanavalin A-like lectin/glucanase superfamily [Cynara cardunculus var. scolymus]|uniref:Concanavalin A-like lectin/glucanase superfamily n=1 Tax=Cynara cardunculus var. scolymus TaxID=59895 RepID=A0A103Y4F0_CYNCS|nr:Concanavalin A-like lectin/glucanase superfamily [Cynara cardunculus var. scolymus]
MNPRKHILFLLIFSSSLFFHPSMAYPRNVAFEFPFLPLQNFTLLGDSYLRNGVAGLTLESDVPASSAGTLIYTTPIRFSDNRTNSTASFTTRFSFSIVSLNPLSSVGDGLSFFISPENHTLGSPGGYLALVNSSKLTQNKFIAIEFDTRLDPYFNDPNENHIGLDINSLNSIKTSDCMSAGIDLRTGISFTTWIDYDNDRKNLQVFLTRSRSKPDYPILAMEIDLSSYFQEYMYLGFSGSTEGTTETHLIENWSFKSSGLKHFNPRINDPHNVTDNTVVKRPPVSDSGDFRKKIQFGLEVSGPVFLFAVLVFFGYISVKKWKSIRIEMNIKAEVTRRPREFSYRELKIATHGFHSSLIIGNGSFGTVYKAFLLTSGTTVAVKRSLRSHEAKTEFFSELSVIARLRHKNLVQLLGWCVEKGELLLVYELMPYGSIDKVLHQDPDHCGFLKWGNRYNIAIGLASALAYLHQECDKLVIHRDIKASEVLDAVDKRLNGEFDEVEGKRLLMVGLSCANPDSEMRPSMRRVLQILENEAEEMVVPPVKPMANFSTSLPMSLEDLVSSSSSDDEEAVEGNGSRETSDSTFEICIDASGK